MTPEQLREIEAVRESAGVWRRDDYTFLRISGSDAAGWLHAQTTNDILKLASGEGNANALLDRQGRVQAHFTVHRWEDEFWLLVETAQAAIVLSSFDSMLFIEDVEIADAGSEVEQVCVEGPKVLSFLAAILDSAEGIASELLPTGDHGCHPVEILGHDVLAFHHSLSGEDGYVFVCEAGSADGLIAALRDGIPSLIEISADARDVLRIEAGRPKFGVDFDASCRISETTLEQDSVSFEKGCYPGQEVVARLRAYGALKQALMGIVVEEGLPQDLAMGALSLRDGAKVGRVTSFADSPTVGSGVVMAYLDRDHRAPDSHYAFVTEAGVSFEGTVCTLPFYAPATREERARALYDEALARFEKDIDDADASAIPLLKEAILLQPEFEDAYEVLGVVLHRHHRIDEAIHYMKRLEALNPNCLMAHTNLSVFYVAKGMIEEAEEEKAKATVLGIQAASDERKAKEMAESERARLRSEAQERIVMFEEVLEIDGEDAVATFGMGKAYIQLNDYEAAIPYLAKAAELQKDYSAAYLNLGKCYEFLDRSEEAVAAYRSGIDCASRKGDLMPMREMERRLKGITAGTGASI